MKRTYNHPQVSVEEFTPNEYVAICWKVGCSNNTTFDNQKSNAPHGNLWKVTEGPYDAQFSHSGDCRNSGNNYFQAKGTNITFEFENNSQQGTLGGGFDKWIDANGNGTVDSNDVVYWHTSNDTRTWNHWGYVESVDKAHINRS